MMAGTIKTLRKSTRLTSKGVKKNESVNKITNQFTVTKRHNIDKLEVNPTKKRKVFAEIKNIQNVSNENLKTSGIEINNKENKISNEDQNIITPSKVYQEAKYIFSRSSAPRFIGRTKEKEVITSFWKQYILNQESSSLYISGCPGTGKSALINEISKEMMEEQIQLKVKNKIKNKDIIYI